VNRRVVDVATWFQQYKVMASARAESCAGDVGGNLHVIAGLWGQPPARMGIRWGHSSSFAASVNVRASDALTRMLDA
jgi:hypothetical protein